MTDTKHGRRATDEPTPPETPAAKATRRIGRPRIIESPEILEQRVHEYFTLCFTYHDPITLSGMILHIGLSSRDGFDEYGRRPEFSIAVKRAKLAVASDYERRMDRDRCAGAIFALKNMGWSDQQTIEFRGVLAKFDLTQLDDALVQRMSQGESPFGVLASTPRVRALLGQPAHAPDPASVGP